MKTRKILIKAVIPLTVTTAILIPTYGLAEADASEPSGDYECCGHGIQESQITYSDDSTLSDEIKMICIEVGDEYGISPELIMAIIECESSGNVYAKNGTCKGLMQVSEKWHSDRMERLGVTSLYDAYGNILVGTDYLAELAERYEDVALCLMIYNGTSDAIEKYEADEISSYAMWVLERSADLEEQHGK